MVSQYIIQNSEKWAYRERDNEQKRRVRTAAALLTSSIADADVVTDWIYFYEIVNRGDDGNPIPSWIRILQLASCICGTFSWLAISSDGRLMNWLREVIWWILWVGVGIIQFLFCIITSTVSLISCGRYNPCCHPIVDRHIPRAQGTVNRFFREGFHVSSGWLLIFGILTEDLPQIIITFLVEDAIGSLGDEGAGISHSAYLNLIVAIFDILHKLASAWDDRKLYIGTGTGARTFTGHTSCVNSLARAGMDRIISASSDGTARLWDIVTGKTVKMFDIGVFTYSEGSILKLGNARFITTTLVRNATKMKVFDIDSGECVKTIDSFEITTCTVVSDNGEYFLTSKRSKRWDSDKLEPMRSEITRWDSKTLEIVQTYQKWADFLLIVGDDRFISANKQTSIQKDGYPILWDVATGNQVQKFNIKNSSSEVTAMCKHDRESFLVASTSDNRSIMTVDLFKVGQSDPIRTMTTKGYTLIVKCIVSVGGDRFIACENGSLAVDLWDISSGTRLHTFRGHSSMIRDIAYLPEEKSIATASYDFTVKVWPIPKHDEDPNNSDIESQG